MTTDTITLARTGKRALQFRGELIASAETHPDQARNDWSGQTGLWQEAKVYRRARGGYVLWLADRTQWQGARDEFRAWPCSTLDEVAARVEDFPPRLADWLLPELGVTEDLDEEDTP